MRAMNWVCSSGDIPLKRSIIRAGSKPRPPPPWPPPPRPPACPAPVVVRKPMSGAEPDGGVVAEREGADAGGAPAGAAAAGAAGAEAAEVDEAAGVVAVA